MSLKINHRREARPDPIGWEQHRSPDRASNADLLWYFFPGDVEILSGGTALASKVGSVPALHFVAAMIGARDALVFDIDSSYSYTFTEADQCINFQRINDDVRIECSFSTNVLTVSIDDFSREICLFSRREIEDLGRDYPALLVHPLVHDLLRKCGDEGEAAAS